MKKMRLFWFLTMIVVICQGCFQSCKEEDKYPPSLRTLAPESITNNSALLNAELVNLGSEPIIRLGFCWLQQIHVNTPRYPMINDNTIEITYNNSSNHFSYLLTELEARQTYYVRAFVETSLGVVYGEVINFITYYDTVTDIDGNVYTIVKIGDQYWTRENLNVTRLRDGTSIPNRTEDFYWGYEAPQEPAMCWYNNNREQYQVPYGALYNWFVASHPLIAPEGWRVPHLEDYEKLNNYLGGVHSNAGGRMKIPGTTYWMEPNSGATNDSDFSAYPAGARLEDSFTSLHYSLLFWASSSYTNSTNLADNVSIQYNSLHFYVNFMSTTHTGFSLRLIKND